MIGISTTKSDKFRMIRLFIQIIIDVIKQFPILVSGDFRMNQIFSFDVKPNIFLQRNPRNGQRNSWEFKPTHHCCFYILKNSKTLCFPDNSNQFLWQKLLFQRKWNGRLSSCHCISETNNSIPRYTKDKKISPAFPTVAAGEFSHD